MPTTYAVTYRVSDGDSISTERVVAQRPFSSRVEVEATGEVVARRVSRFGVLAVEGERAVSVLAVSPSLGTSDVRPDAVLDEAVDRGLAERREVRAVEGRRCQVYRVGASVSDGSLVPIGTTVDEHADVCVDGAGLVLEEWWVRDGRPLRQRLAVEVDVGRTVDDAVFSLDGETDASASPDDGRVTATNTDPATTITTPPGFQRRGRYEVTPAQVGRTTVVDVWTRGIDFLVLEQGAGDVDRHPHGSALDVPGVGTGELILDLRASEIRFALGGLTVRIYGTLPPDALADVAGSLAVPLGRQ